MTQTAYLELWSFLRGLFFRVRRLPSTMEGGTSSSAGGKASNTEISRAHDGLRDPSFGELDDLPSFSNDHDSIRIRRQGCQGEGDMEEPDDVEEVPGLWDYGSASGDYGGLCGENRPSHVYPIERAVCFQVYPDFLGLWGSIMQFQIFLMWQEEPERVHAV
ncbi:hypothetical protein B0H14DRAFT_3151396 [Mycena olivaceomarginata]|nr:hypothetical protein B0H14DRAFT_3151396 [Mycena olivaceomarginata]